MSQMDSVKYDMSIMEIEQAQAWVFHTYTLFAKKIPSK